MLAGIGLVSTLLVTIVLAYGKHTRQIRTSQRRLVAIEAADKWLLDWSQTPEMSAKPTAGQVTDDPSMTWRFNPVNDRQLSIPGVGINCLEIVDADRAGGQQVLVKIEVLVRSGPTNRDGQGK